MKKSHGKLLSYFIKNVVLSGKGIFTDVIVTKNLVLSWGMVKSSFFFTSFKRRL